MEDAVAPPRLLDVSHPAAPPLPAAAAPPPPAGPTWIVRPARATHAVAALRAELPAASVHFAYKSCPVGPIAEAVVAAGASFEVASLAELEAVVAHGADPATVLFSNPVKSPADVAGAFALGLRRFCVDSEREVAKVAAYAPGASIYVRLRVDNSASTFPLDAKFGADADQSVALLLRARDLGLEPWGVTFHVGSHCPDPVAWTRAIAAAGAVIRRAAAVGIDVVALNIGGGFPALGGDDSRLAGIGAAIRDALGALPPVELFAEPGRLVAADAVDLVATVIGRATRSDAEWVYLDVGVFSGLMEARDARPEVLPAVSLLVPRPAPLTAFTLAGPTCDQADCVGTGVLLPDDIEIGDRLLLTGAGAYSLSYVGAFCGVAPPAITVVGP